MEKTIRTELFFSLSTSGLVLGDTCQKYLKVVPVPCQGNPSGRSHWGTAQR